MGPVAGQADHNPGRVSEGSLQGSLKGSPKGLWRVSEGFLKGFRRGPRLTPSKTLLKPFRGPSETLQRPVQRPLQRPLLIPFWNPSGVGGSCSRKWPCPSFPCFFFCGIPCFFPLQGFPCFFFLRVFPLFSRDFRCSPGIKNPCFFGGVPCPFPKKNKERKDRVVFLVGCMGKEFHWKRTSFLGIPIVWYKARIPGFPRKSIREGASSPFGPRPERPQNISCSRATQTCTGATLGLL